MSERPELVMDADAIERFLEQIFPQANSTSTRITRCDLDGLELTMQTSERHLRPGGTVSGPTLMTLADSAAFFAVLSRVGPKALAVTSSLEIHFLRKALPGVLTATARVLKLGRRLSVVQVDFRSGGDDALIAAATVTYAIPV